MASELWKRTIARYAGWMAALTLGVVPPCHGQGTQLVFSTYAFERREWQLGGRYYFLSTLLPARDAGLLAFSPPPLNLGATLSLVRPSNERVISLSSLASFAYSNLQMAGVLGGGGKLLHNAASDVTTSFAPLDAKLDFEGVRPYDLHGNYAASMATLKFAFHVNTPGGCYAHEGTLAYHIQFYIDEGGLLHAHTNGGTFTQDVNPDACAGAVNDSLRTVASDALLKMEVMIAAWIGQQVQASRFRMLYLIPGDGDRSGYGFGDADARVSLGLVPR
jgi:hypothetical protein